MQTSMPLRDKDALRSRTKFGHVLQQFDVQRSDRTDRVIKKAIKQTSKRPMLLSSPNHLAKSLPFLIVFDKPSSTSHYSINDFKNSLKTTSSSLYLDKASNRQADLASVLENDKKFNLERNRLDIQSVVLVDSSSDCVGLAGVLKIPDAMPLPLFE